MYSLTRERLFPNRWPLSYIKCNYMYAIHCLSTMCVRNVHYGHNSKPFCDVLEQFQHFVKIMKSDLHVYNVKMTMLPALNYHEILLISRGNIWHVFMQIWYLDKDWNIFIF